MFSKLWLKRTAELLLRTAAQATIATIGADAMNVIVLGSAGAWTFIGGMTLLSLLTSIVATPLGTNQEKPTIL